MRKLRRYVAAEYIHAKRTMQSGRSDFVMSGVEVCSVSYRDDYIYVRCICIFEKLSTYKYYTKYRRTSSGKGIQYSNEMFGLSWFLSAENVSVTYGIGILLVRLHCKTYEIHIFPSAA